MYGIRKIWKPDIFQGARRGDGYFEGWYFKSVSRDQSAAVVLIPGISYAAGDRHAFIQVFDGKRGRYQYHRYPIESFSFSRRKFSLAVAGSSFSAGGCELNIDTPEQRLEGQISFSSLNPWPVTVFSPGAMGWYAFVPGMEDYHGVLSFYHTIEGNMRIDDDYFDFSGGTGYIEKDWGVSFPSRWIWMQSNHFAGQRASVSLSVATIPWKGRSFTGYIIGFWLDGTLYSFSTYAGGIITDFAVGSDAGSGHSKVVLTVSAGQYTLSVTGIKAEGTRLKAPVAGGMTGHVNESLTAEVSVRLWKGEGTEPLFDGTGVSAGIELHGDIEDLLQAAVKPEKR